MSRVVACIDGSRAASAVCEYAAYACQRMEAPLTLFHVLNEERYPVEPDLAGTIGLGSREHLMEELAELDQKRSKLALEQGHHMLDAAEQRVQSHGVQDVIKRQRHGDLTDSLLAIENETRLVVMGLHGESSTERDVHIGSQQEHDIDLLVMGAYGHSRIRQFLVGSTTTNMLRTAEKPLVILR